MQNGMGRPGPFYHMNDVSVYLGRQRRERSLFERTHFTSAIFILNQEQYIFHFMNIQNSSAWGQKLQDKASSSFFDGGPLPRSVYLGRHWCTRPSPSIFAYCRQSKTGRWEGLGTRLAHLHHYGSVTHAPFYIFLGHTFNLVFGRQCICACAVSHPLCRLWEGCVEPNWAKRLPRDCSCKKCYSSDDL